MGWLRLQFTPSEEASLHLFRDLLVANSRSAGLTSVRDPDEVDKRHIGESLVLLQALDGAGLLRSPAIDIGSGGGLPGIPIKIVRPHLKLTLLEATKKKAAFLQLAVDELRLEDTIVVNARAEEAARQPEHRATYALALARSVAPLPALIELALPFLSEGGVLAAPKGSRAAAEIDAAVHALRECGGEVESVRKLELPWDAPPPTLVIVRKIAPTPDRYPRRPGIPSRRPL